MRGFYRIEDLKEFGASRAFSKVPAPIVKRGEEMPEPREKESNRSYEARLEAWTPQLPHTLLMRLLATKEWAGASVDYTDTHIVLTKGRATARLIIR